MVVLILEEIVIDFFLEEFDRRNDNENNKIDLLSKFIVVVRCGYF